MTELLTPRTIGGLQVVKANLRQPWMNLLIYGKSGVGKTKLLGSCDAVPSMRKVLIVDVEGGTLTLKDTFPNAEVVRVTSWDDIQNIYDELYAGNHDFSTVGIDSITETQKFNMSEVMKQRLTAREELDPDIPDMRAWGKNIEQIRKFIRAFRDLPMHTVFTALEKSEKNNRTGLTHVKPYLSGKLADEIAGFLDVVLYLYIKEVDGEQTRLLLTGATDEIVAKDRTNRLPIVIQEPTMAELFKLIEAETQETETQTETEETND